MVDLDRTRATPYKIWCIKGMARDEERGLRARM
jgi:hypothetical protein